MRARRAARASPGGRAVLDRRPSCLLASSAAELAGVDAEVGERVERVFRELSGRSVSAVARAQEEGDIDPDADALGDLLLAVAPGLEALGHAGMPEASLVGTAEAAIAGPPRPPR